MGMFVLTYFKDDERAKEFVDFSEFKGVRVVGIYKDPLHEPCKCGPDQWKNNRMWGLSRVHGWPVHLACGRVSPHFRAGYGKRMFQVFGRNLLPVKQTPKIFRDWKQESDPTRNALGAQQASHAKASEIKTPIRRVRKVS